MIPFIVTLSLEILFDQTQSSVSNSHSNTVGTIKVTANRELVREDFFCRSQEVLTKTDTAYHITHIVPSSHYESNIGLLTYKQA